MSNGQFGTLAVVFFILAVVAAVVYMGYAMDPEGRGAKQAGIFVIGALVFFIACFATLARWGWARWPWFGAALLSLACLMPAQQAMAQAAPATNGTAFTLTARSTTATTADLTNASGFKGLHLVINVTAYTNGSWIPRIQAKDALSSQYYDLLVGSAIVGTGTTVLKLYPGITSSVNAAASDVLPRTFRFQMGGVSPTNATFQAGYVLLP